jgi:uncharacterized protein YjbJ (UPF0337 family)
MDKDRAAGTGKKLKGKLKEAAGRMTGDENLEAEGTGEKVEGKVQKGVGQAKDAARETFKDC